MPPNSTRPTDERQASRRRALAVSVTALLLVAAGELAAGVDRIRALPASERIRLLESLRDFDLKLTAEQRSAVREMDRRLSEMAPGERAQYLVVLRRYHAWLNALPDQRQEELAAQPPSERMATVRRLLRDRPVPTGDTPTMLRRIEPGELSPFEVASAYRIWQALGPDERARVDRATSEVARRIELFRLGQRLKPPVPRETVPEGFDEEKWSGQARGLDWEGLRPIAFLEEAGKAKAADAAKKRAEKHRSEVVHRLAINCYVSRSPVPDVDPERLDRFVAALPPWIPESFTSLAPDEARRRMSFAYRQLFPSGQEIGARPKPAGAASGKSAPTPAPRPAAPPKANPRPPANGAPF